MADKGHFSFCEKVQDLVFPLGAPRFQPHGPSALLWRGQAFTTSLYTVRSFAPICSSLISTMFLELILMQSHTARQRKIHNQQYFVLFLGTSWQIVSNIWPFIAIQCYVDRGEWSTCWKLCLVWAHFEIFHYFSLHLMGSLGVALRLWSCVFVMLLTLGSQSPSQDSQCFVRPTNKVVINHVSRLI